MSQITVHPVEMAQSETCFPANFDLINAKNPGLAQQFRALPLVNLRLGRNQKGDLVGQSWDMLTQLWVPLCNPEDPWGEAEHDVDALYTPNAKIFALFGLGLGYFAHAFAKRLLPYQRLAIFETNPTHYLAAMHTLDMTPILGDRHVDTFLGDNLDAALQQWWLGLQSHEKFHIASPMRAGFTGACDKPTYDALMLRTMDMHRYHAVGLATWAQFGKLIGDNDLGNLPEFMVTPGLGEMKSLWQGRPAVCVAAGPSLHRNLRLLADPQQRQKVAVLSVGTVYALLQHLGIHPDVVTTIDFQRLNWTDQFLNVPLDPDTALVYLHSTYPSTPRRWPGPKFVALNSSDTVEWMRRYTEDKPNAAQVQTVAHLNLVTALHLGANPIILIGQDLSMPHDAHHALGARAQDQAPEEGPAEAHIQADDIYGNPCWSRHSLLSMRTVFQQIIAAHPDRTFLNCSEGGIHIEGTTNRPLADVLGEIEEPLPGMQRQLAPMLKRVWQGYTPQTRWSDLDRDLRKLQTSVGELAEVSKTICRDYEEWQASEGDTAKRDLLVQKILSNENRFQGDPVTFGLFAVRRFDLVELLSAIPLPPDTSEAEVVAHNLERLQKVAAALLDELPIVQDLLRCTRNRLNDVNPELPKASSPPQLLRLMARESFDAFAQAMRTQAVPIDARTQAQFLSHRNQYTAAIATLDMAGVASGVSERWKSTLAAHHKAMQPLLFAYFASESKPEPPWLASACSLDMVSTVDTIGVSDLPLEEPSAA